MLAAKERRHAIRLSYANALFWALGNGMVTTTLVIYLALELGAAGMAISWIVASPRFAGVLRVGAPALISEIARLGWGGRKRVCLFAFALSASTLAAVPGAAIGAGRHGASWGIAALVTAWCVYHLLEYTGVIALWSWLGDLYPQRMRSRLIGRREGFLVAGRVIGILLSLALTLLCGELWPTIDRWIPLATSAAFGAAWMLLAVAPLIWMPALSGCPSAAPEAPWRTLGRALKERAYRRLLAYSCALSFANGVTGAAMSLYPQRVLEIGYREMVGMRALMFGGQAAVAPLAGGWIGRWGAKRVMFVAQLFVATGPLFYLCSGPIIPYLFTGDTAYAWSPWIVCSAFVVWVLYAPLNVGLDTLKLDVANAQNTAPYLAVYHALSEGVNGLTILLGGLAYDSLNRGGADVLGLFALFFVVGWLLRTLTAVLILRLEEKEEAL